MRGNYRSSDVGRQRSPPAAVPHSKSLSAAQRTSSTRLLSAKLAHQVGAVGLDRPHRHPQLLGRLTIGVAADDEAQDVGLARGQGFLGAGRRPRALRGLRSSARVIDGWMYISPRATAWMALISSDSTARLMM